MRLIFIPVRALKKLIFNKKLQGCMEYVVQRDQVAKRYTALVETECCQTFEETSLPTCWVEEIDVSIQVSLKRQHTSRKQCLRRVSLVRKVLD